MATTWSSPPHVAQESMTFVHLMWILRHYWRSIALTTVSGTALAWLAVSQMTPMYRAEAVLVLEVRETRFAELDSVIQRPDGTLTWPWLARSEAEVLRSETLIGRVIERLDLLEHPAFRAEPNPVALVAQRTVELLQPWVPSAVGSDDSPQPEKIALTGVVPPAAETPGELIEQYRKSLSTTHDDETFVLRVAFEAPDPRLAALIANTHAEVYLEDQTDRKTTAVRTARAWLDQQVAMQGEKLRRSEDAVQAYRAQHSIIDVGDDSVVDARMAELSSALMQAQADLHAKTARLHEVRNFRVSDGDLATLADVVASPVIQGLRQQQATLRSSQAALATTLGPRHPQWRYIEQQLGELGIAMAEEMRRIEASLASEAEIARQRVAELRADLAVLEQQVLAEKAGRVALLELEREATANRQLFEGLLERYKEVITQADLAAPDARIITAARAPQEPHAPPTKVLLAFAFVVSAGLGIGSALARERVNGTARRPDDIKQAASIPCLATLPAVAELSTPFVTGSAIAEPVRLWAPARYVEGVRAVRAMVERDAVEGQPLRLLVTSSLPGEGKTTLSIALAQEMATAGRRTVLIDADLRRNGAARLLGYAQTPGQHSGVAERSPLGFTFLNLQAFMAEIVAPNAQEADHLRRILDLNKHDVDRIIIDCAPVTAVADPLLFAPDADITLLVVRSHRTQAALLGSVADRLLAAGARRIDAVLNHVDLKRRAAFYPDDFDYYHKLNGKYYS